MAVRFVEIDPTSGTHDRMCPECESTRLETSYTNGRFKLIQEDGKPDEVEIIDGDREVTICLKCRFASPEIADFIVKE